MKAALLALLWKFTRRALLSGSKALRNKWAAELAATAPRPDVPPVADTETFTEGPE